MKNFNKIIATLLTVMMIASMMTFVTSAAWDGYTSTKPAGSGTESDPFLISNGEELCWVAETVNSKESDFGGQYLKLTADIDLGGAGWICIGYSTSVYFAGNFDGCGHTVKNFNVSKSTVVSANTKENSRYGLFGVASGAVIKNIHFEDANTTGVEAGYISIVCGHAMNETLISGCTVASDCTAANGHSVGSIAGRLEAGSTIENCVNYGTVIAEKVKKTVFVGGIVGCSGKGATGTDNPTIRNCVNYGTVSSTRPSGSGSNFYSGGIVGCLGATDGVVVRNCVNYGSVESPQYAGGLFGDFHTDNNDIENCYNMSNQVTGGDGEAIAVPSAVGGGAVVGWIRYNAGVKNVYSVPVSGLDIAGNNEANMSLSGMTISTTVEIDAKAIADEVEAALIHAENTAPSETTKPTEGTTEPTPVETTTSSEETPKPVETTTAAKETTKAPEAETTTSAPAPAKSGCGSAVGLAMLACVIPAAVVIFRKKKN